MPWLVLLLLLVVPEGFGATTFDRAAFRREFLATDFVDKNGERFRFGGLTEDGFFDRSIQHSVLGALPEKAPRRTPEEFCAFWLNANDPFQVDGEGNLHGTTSGVDYGTAKNRGFLGALFTFFRERLPENVTFELRDSSETSHWLDNLLEAEDDTVRAFLRADGGARLLALYQRVYHLPSFQKAVPGERDPASDPGFRRYLFDLFSIWGRVARRADFRGPYTRSLSANPDKSLRFVKRHIPDDIREAEDALVKELGRKALFPLGANQIAGWDD